MKKKLLSILLAFVMVIGMLPTTALAAESTPEVWVGGVGMVSGDYLHEGATAVNTAAPADSSIGYAYYEDGVLTLHNYDYTGSAGTEVTFATYYRYTAAITFQAEKDLTVALEGDNTLKLDNMPEEADTTGIHVPIRSTLTIRGTGSLAIEEAVYGITTAYGRLILDGATVSLDTTSDGIRLYEHDDNKTTMIVRNGSELTIEAGSDGIYNSDYASTSNPFLDIIDSEVNITADDQGIYSDARGMDISGNSEVSITSEDEGIYLGDGDLTLSDTADVTITATVNEGMRVDDLIIEDTASLDVTAVRYGVEIDLNLKMSGGSLDVESKEGIGLDISRGISMSGGTVTVTAKENHGITMGGYGDNAINKLMAMSGGTINITAGLDGLLIGGGYSDPNLEMTGGTINITAEDNAVKVDGDLTIEDGTITVTAEEDGMEVGGDVTIEDGTVTVTAQYNGIYAHGGEKAITINGGKISVKSLETLSDSSYYALNGTTTFAEGLTVQASTEPDGTLDAYVAANHTTYDYIKITAPAPTPEIWVGGVGLVSGQYLDEAGNVGTEELTDNYAYYNNRVLTLKNYNYSGAGIKDAAIYYTVGLDIVLIGENELENTSSDGNGITVSNGYLKMYGSDTDDKLTVIVNGMGIDAETSVIIENCSVDFTTKKQGIYSHDSAVSISGADVKISASDNGIRANNKFTIADSTVNIDATKNGIYVSTGNQSNTVSKSTLTIESDQNGINANYDVAFTDTDLTIDAQEYGICVRNGDVKVTNSNVEIKSTATESEGEVWAVMMNEEFIVDEDLTIQASTEPDGSLGEYVASTHNTYDYIKITAPTPEVWVGGVGMFDGDYLAKGASATTTTALTDNYAYYNDDVLTLKNYDYSGAGYQNSAVYYDGTSDLDIELKGENTLTVDANTSANCYGIQVANATLDVIGEANSKLTIKDSSTGKAYGIWAKKDLSVENTTLDIDTVNTGLYSDTAKTSVEDSTLSVQVSGRYSNCLTGYNNITITGTTMNCVSKDGTAVSVSNGGGDCIVLNDSEVTIEASESGFYSNTNVKVTDCELTINAGNDGIRHYNGAITFTNSTVDITAALRGICRTHSGNRELRIIGSEVDIKSQNTYDDDSFYSVLSDIIVFGEGVKVQASTEPDGTLVSYVPRDHNTYDRIKTTLADENEEKPAERTLYYVSAAINPSKKGTVSGVGCYSDGETATLTAVPTAGYRFVRWTTESGTNTLSANATYSFEVNRDANCALKAHFEKIKYTITVTADPTEGGTVQGETSYATYGDSRQIVAKATDGYKFVKWTENGATVSTDEKYTFTVTGNRDLVAVFKEDFPTVTIVVKKTDGEGAPLAGAEFALTSNVDGGEDYTATSDANGIATFTEVEHGSYTLRETAAPTGYQLDAHPEYIDVNSEGKAIIYGEGEGFEGGPKEYDNNDPFVFENEQYKATFFVTKTDGTAALAGAEFKLENTVAGRTGYTATSAADGKVTFTDVVDGEYILSETKAPAGYTGTDIPVYFKVQNGVVHVAYVVQGTRGEYAEYSNTLSIANTKIPSANIELYKYEQPAEDAEVKIALQGAEFALTRDGETTAAYTAVSGEDGKVTFEGVLAGEYILRETKAPEGYNLSAVTYRFRVVDAQNGEAWVYLFNAENVTEDFDGYSRYETAMEFYNEKTPVPKYTISFDTNGGTPASIDPIVEPAGTDLTGRKPASPTKAGYAFQRWDKAFPETMPEEDLVLTAVWEANEYYVDFNANGGNGEMQSQKFVYDAEQNLTANAFTKTGYQFAGWQDAAGNSYTDKQAVKNLVATDWGRITLVAQWEKADITFTVDPNGGEFAGGSKAPISVTVKHLDMYTLPEVTREGYSITAWYTVDANNMELRAALGNPEEVRVGLWSGKTLFPKWEANTYTVEFDGNDATAGEMADQSFTYDEAAKALTKNAFSKAGYHFIGWKDADGNAYTDEQEVQNLTAENNGVVILYAQWEINEYTVTFDSKGGSAVDNQTVEHGQKATEPAAPTRSGYKFRGWTLNGEVYDFNTAVTDDITLVAQWSKKSSGGSLYDVILEETKHGDVESSHKTAGKGTTITITVDPDKGYEVEDITVTKKNGDEIKVTKKSETKYTFTMPAADVYVDVDFEKEAAWPFTDVDEDDDCYDAVKFMYENGLMAGIGDGSLFAPDMDLSRAMTARIFHVLEGAPVAASASDFTDVARNFWYTAAIDWAAEDGVISGYGDGTFGPNDDVTKEQLAVMLYQYAQSKGYDVTLGNTLEQPDANTVSYWAVDAMTWAVNNGIIAENSVGYLASTDAATRADVAHAFMAFVQLYA